MSVGVGEASCGGSSAAHVAERYEGKGSEAQCGADAAWPWTRATQYEPGKITCSGPVTARSMPQMKRGRPREGVDRWDDNPLRAFRTIQFSYNRENCGFRGLGETFTRRNPFTPRLERCASIPAERYSPEIPITLRGLSVATGIRSTAEDGTLCARAGPVRREHNHRLPQRPAPATLLVRDSRRLPARPSIRAHLDCVHLSTSGSTHRISAHEHGCLGRRLPTQGRRRGLQIERTNDRA